MMRDTLQNLNEKQREAVRTTEGFVRVIAGAGSGKTRALAHRFAYLVNDMGVLPGSILCATFTNKSAVEMRQRIRALTGDRDTGFICTFHSFCVSVLQEEAHTVQYPDNFLVLDNPDIDDMLAALYEERGLTLRDMTFAAARDRIEIRKTKTETLYYEDMIAMPLDILRQKYLRASYAEDIIFYGYLYQERKCFGLDYNDLINFVLYIFKEHPEIREKWQKRLEYIMVDEFQDIDELQYKLMRVLCGYHKNLFLVGDPDQTIYTWRGANVGYLLNFDQAFPDTHTIFMMQNYRSTPEILATANCLVSRNKNRIPKDLTTENPHGAKPLIRHAKSAEEEAMWIAQQVQELTARGARFSDVAILYRAHYVTRTIEEVFLREQIPYVLFSGVPFFHRAEIQTTLAYLRLIAYRDDLAFARAVNTPRRNIGKKRQKLLREYAETHGVSLFAALQALADTEEFRSTKAASFLHLIEELTKECATGRPVSELLAAVLEKSGYEEMLRTEGSGERLGNLAELRQAVREYELTSGEEAGLTDYLSHVALFSNRDATVDKNAVRCMTVHTAKGLEFPYVFLCSMNEGIFPSKKTATAPQMEEERRLAFVALTRAEQGLFLSEAQGNHHDGTFRYPSRFVLELDRSLVEFAEPPDEELLEQARQEIAWSERHLPSGRESRFAIGTRVKHEIMGGGEIVDVDETRGGYVIRFDALPTERRISFHVPLEPEKNEEP